MKILFITPDIPYSHQLILALKANGADVVWVQDRKNRLVPGFLRSSLFLWHIVRGISFLKRINNRLLHKEILQVCHRERPDVMLTIKGMTLSSDLIAQIRAMGITTVNWFQDSILNPVYAPWVYQHVSDYDHFFHFDSLAVQMLKERGHTNVHTLSVGIDASFLKAQPDTEAKAPECDICFVGAWYPEREPILLALKDRGLKVFGWPGWQKTPLKDVYGGVLTPGQFAALYRTAKICLNINLQPPVHGVNLKTFEIPAAGGFQITDYRKDLDSLFEEGKEIVTFKDIEDLQAKITYYLEHEDERRSVIAAGHNRVRRDHTLVQRIRTMLDIIQ
jgi:spore maturation protein CgeB